MKIKKIETYSLYEFCQAVEENIKDGWRFDFSSNDLFPTAFGSMLVAGMIKTETEDKLQLEVKFEEINEVVVQDNTEVKRGRKPKNNI